jgi:hypothetical protein
MRQQGVKQVLIQDVMGYEGVEYDSILMLMNGIGIAGDLDGLEKLLIHLKKIVKPAGQLLVDSTDISYLYEGAVRPEEKIFWSVGISLRIPRRGRRTFSLVVY